MFRLLGWSEGSFAFRPDAGRVATQITTPTRALLLEGMRQLDEGKRLRTQLPSRDAHVALKVRSGTLPSVVQPLTQEVLPQMQRRLPWRETAAQLVWLAGGLSVVMFALRLLHSH